MRDMATARENVAFNLRECSNDSGKRDGVKGHISAAPHHQGRMLNPRKLRREVSYRAGDVKEEW